MGQLRWFPRARSSGLMASGHAVSRTCVGAAGHPAPVPVAKARQKPSRFSSLFQLPLEGRRMSGNRDQPRSLSQRAVGSRGCSSYQMGPEARQRSAWPPRDPAQIPGKLGLSCPRVTLACAGSVLEEGRGPSAEQHDAPHQGGGRAAHAAGAQRPGGRCRAVHCHRDQRGGGHLLQRHPQRAAR